MLPASAGLRLGAAAPCAAAAAAPAAAEVAARSLRCWQGSEQELQAPAAGGDPVAPSQKMAGEPKVRTVATLVAGSTPLRAPTTKQQQPVGLRVLIAQTSNSPSGSWLANQGVR